MSMDVYVVTGASRGIGRAVALQLAAPGRMLVINYARDAGAAAEVAAACLAKGAKAVAVQGDVANEKDVVALFAEADRHGRLAGLVNNAGIVAKAQRIEDYDGERLARMMAVNVSGSILCAREAVKRMATDHGGQGGAIVNLSSVAAVLGSPNEFIDYAASKGAIDSFTIGLAKEVAARGIRVNAVRPGMIDTDIHATAGVPDRVAKFRSVIPMLREGSADEVASTIVFLLSDAASYVTGAILTVSGGR